MQDKPPTAKEVLNNEFFVKGMTPGEVAKNHGIRPATLQIWCDNRGIQYPETGPRDHIKSLTKSDIELDFPDVETPDYTAKWEKERNENNEDDEDLDGALDW